MDLKWRKGERIKWRIKMKRVVLKWRKKTIYEKKNKNGDTQCELKKKYIKNEWKSYDIWLC